MIVYLKYFVIWLLFMGLIAAVTLVVPKLAKVIEKKIQKIKETRKSKFGVANLSDEAILPEEMLETPDSSKDE
ncbi:MAG: hypothetical protein IIX60_00385 [Clostridia bacterium]|nr:hypothetical protein [Clostridia bacterium]